MLLGCQRGDLEGLRDQHRSEGAGEDSAFETVTEFEVIHSKATIFKKKMERSEE